MALGGTLALPLNQTTRSSFCQCRRLCPHPQPPRNVATAMQRRAEGLTALWRELARQVGLTGEVGTIEVNSQSGAARCILADCGGRSGEPS